MKTVIKNIDKLKALSKVITKVNLWLKPLKEETRETLCEVILTSPNLFKLLSVEGRDIIALTKYIILDAIINHTQEISEKGEVFYNLTEKEFLSPEEEEEDQPVYIIFDNVNKEVFSFLMDVNLISKTLGLEISALKD